MTRQAIIEKLANLIVQVDRPHPLRVAIDGPGAAGKTILADELIHPIEQRGRTVIRASIDGFHNPPEVRYRRGRDSIDGYYHDSFDCQGVRDCLLLPLGPKGSCQFHRAKYDFRTETEVNAPLEQADDNAVLIFEGVFTLRPGLREHFDFAIYVDVDFAVTIERAARRDTSLFGSADNVRERYQWRYIPGQQHYIDTCRPHEVAHAVIDNNDPQTPILKLAMAEMST